MPLEQKTEKNENPDQHRSRRQSYNLSFWWMLNAYSMKLNYYCWNSNNCATINRHTQYCTLMTGEGAVGSRPTNDSMKLQLPWRCFRQSMDLCSFSSQPSSRVPYICYLLLPHRTTRPIFRIPTPSHSCLSKLRSFNHFPNRLRTVARFAIFNVHTCSSMFRATIFVLALSALCIRSVSAQDPVYNLFYNNGAPAVTLAGPLEVIETSVFPGTLDACLSYCSTFSNCLGTAIGSSASTSSFAFLRGIA